MPARPRILLSFLVLALLASAARADTPLPPPREHEVRSADGSHVAVSVPRTATTTVSPSLTPARIWALTAQLNGSANAARSPSAAGTFTALPPATPVGSIAMYSAKAPGYSRLMGVR